MLSSGRQCYLVLVQCCPELNIVQSSELGALQSQKAAQSKEIWGGVG